MIVQIGNAIALLLWGVCLGRHLGARRENKTIEMMGAALRAASADQAKRVIDRFALLDAEDRAKRRWYHWWI